jgi:hypothetical protein
MDELIQSRQNAFLYFRDEKARFWAENTVDEEGRNFVEWFVPNMVDGVNYLVFHPDDDSSPGNIPDGFEGHVFQFPMTDEMRESEAKTVN